MSFDIHFHTCNLSIKKKTVKNPFTGKVMEINDDDGLTSEECRTVSELLKNANTQIIEDGYYVKFQDGGDANVILDLDSKCVSGAVSVSDFTPNLLTFVYALSRAGNMIIIPMFEGAPTIATTHDQQRNAKARWPGVVVISSTEELRLLLEQAVKAWRKHVDRVTGP